MKTWTTTPAGARAALAARATPDGIDVDANALAIWPDACILRVPSPFAAAMIASRLPDYASGPAGIHRPSSLAAALDLCGQTRRRGDAAPWSRYRYPTTPPRHHAHCTCWSWREYYCDIATACGWEGSYPSRYRIGSPVSLALGGVAILSDEPSIEAVEPLGSIVMRWPDGTVTASRGWTVLDHRFITRPHTLSASQIDRETDEELRSWAIEHRTDDPAEGWSWYLEQTGAQLLHQRSNDVEGTQEALFATTGRGVLLVTCPTRRMFALGVPADVTTCEQAQEWLHSAGGPGRVVART